MKKRKGQMNKLREVIFFKKMRQIEIATKIGMDPSQFNKIVNGWFPLPDKYKDKLCQVLGVTPKDLQ